MKRFSRLAVLGGIVLLTSQLSACILVPVPRHHSVAPVIAAPVAVAPVVAPAPVVFVPPHVAHMQRRISYY